MNTSSDTEDMSKRNPHVDVEHQYQDAGVLAAPVWTAREDGDVVVLTRHFTRYELNLALQGGEEIIETTV